MRDARDMDILLVDAVNVFGNGYMLPRGTLYGTTAACLAVCLAYTACGDGLYPYFAAVWLVCLAALAWRYRRLAGRLKTRNNR